MFSHWATKRICKFFLKRLLGRILRGDLDTEQLEVQLGSGIIQLNDLALNTEYLNDQLADASVVVKEGSVKSVTVKIPWKVLASEQCEIEVDELELVLAPRRAGQATTSNSKLNPINDPNPVELQHVGSEADLSGSEVDGGCTYLGVHDGVRMIAKMVERVLLGLHVRIRNLLVAFEEQPSNTKRVISGRKTMQANSHVSHSMLIIRIGYIEYGAASPDSRREGHRPEDSFGTESVMLAKVVKFQDATIEVLDVLKEDADCTGCSLLKDRGAGNKMFSRPVPIVVGEEGLSGCIQLSMPWKNGCISTPKLNAELSVTPLKMIISAYEIQQLFNLAQSFGESKKSDFPHVQASVANQNNILSSCGRLNVTAVDNERENPGSVACLSQNLYCQSESSNTSPLPFTTFISDWMLWAGSANQKKEDVSEADLAASVDEFFDCFDGTRSSQASLSGSGLWTWTCSAFSAITAASSLASGSVLMPQGGSCFVPDAGRQVEYDIKIKILGVSAALVLDDVGQDKGLGFATVAPRKNNKDKTDLQKREEKTLKKGGSDVHPGHSCYHDLDGWDLDSLDIMDENVTKGFMWQDRKGVAIESNHSLAFIDSRKDFVEARLSDVNFSLQVLKCQSVLRLTVAQADVCEHTWHHLEDFEANSYQGSGGLLKTTSCAVELLQGLLEDALPIFPVTLGTGGMAVKMQQKYGRCSDARTTYGGKSKQDVDDPLLESCKCRGKGVSRGYKKKPLLRLSALGHDFAVYLNMKWDLPFCGGDRKDSKVQSHTKIELHLQPVVLWLDANVLSRLLKLLEASALSSHGLQGQSVQNASCFKPDDITGSILNADIYVPCLRVLVCSPSNPKVTSVKDEFLCLDLHAASTNTNVTEPFLAVKVCNSPQAENSFSNDDSFVLRFGHGALYLISMVDIAGTSTADSDSFGSPGFSAQKIFKISQQENEDVIVKVRCGHELRGGVWIAEQAWNGIVSHAKKGDGVNGVGGSNSEFAAATATEEAEENNRIVRQNIVACSSVFIQAILPRVRLDLFGFQHVIILGLIDSFLEYLLPENAQMNFQSQDEFSSSVISNTETGTNMAQSSQTSILIDVSDIEITIHPKHTVEASPQPGIKGTDRKENAPWDILRFEVQNVQLLSAFKLGMIDDASYFWLRHEAGQACGSSRDSQEKELLLLRCNDDALGRGDGRGGNALATGSAGIEVTCVAWPGRQNLEDVMITATVRGGTFVAYGGRLDWLPTIVSFFSQSLDEGTTCVVVEKGCSVIAETGLSCLEVDTLEAAVQPVLHVKSNHTFFLLDLQDIALCYEPGHEAIMAATISAGGMAQKQHGAMESFSPVACTLAAAAVRVTTNIFSNTSNQEYKIWFRDVALLLLNTTLTKQSIVNYTTESMQQAGYVKVAGEAVMEAIVRLNGEEGLQWEVECANNQLRLDTCHDTAAALGRLVAQLQQLFVPVAEHSSIHLHARKADQSFEKTCDNFFPSGKSSLNLEHIAVKLANGKEPALLEGVLEDAFLLVRDTTSKVDKNVKCVSGAHDFDSSRARRQEPSSCFDFSHGRWDGRVAGPAGDFPSTSSQHLDLHKETRDLCVPCEQNIGLPSFIEDYYVTRNKGPFSSASLYFKQTDESQSSTDSSDVVGLETVEGRGGWYEGDSIEVLENHIPDVNCRSQCKNRKGCFSKLVKNRSGLAVKYPLSISRVVLQDLNVRWRLYGGSDWPVKKNQENVVSISHQREGGRQWGVCLEVLLDGVELQHDTFPDTGLYASRLVVCVRDVRVYDSSKDAPWKKVLGYYQSSSCPRESSAQALKLELDAVRPDPTAPLEEYRLSLDLLPIRLHLDQRHLDFFIDFFSSHTSSSAPQELVSGRGISSLNTTNGEGSKPISKTTEPNEEALLPFFQIFETQPFTIRVDYIPRQVDLAALGGGNYAELFNLVSWKGIELQLKHIHAAGVHGWGTLSGIVVGEWLEDISRNQVHKIIKGLGPIRPLFALGSGAAKLVVLPTEHYRKDRRLLRGMRKGAMAFLRSISLEAVGLGVHLAAGAHELLLHTESALSGVPSSMSYNPERREAHSKVSQPGDTREGLQQACESITRGLERTAASLIGNPMKVYQRGAGASLAVASALRAAPTAALAPASAAAGAVHRALLGVRNSLDPEHKRESEEKHSGPTPATKRNIFSEI